MGSQPKYKAQSLGLFFADSSEMRPIEPGTVAFEDRQADDPYYSGKDSSGNFVAKAPVEITLPDLLRGQERFNIYCSPCHGRVGDGKGIVVNYGYIPPPSYHIDRLRQVPDGYIFDLISNGIRNMPSYGPQIPVTDRWRIVMYVRALQRSQNATLNDIPEELRGTIK